MRSGHNPYAQMLETTPMSKFGNGYNSTTALGGMVCLHPLLSGFHAVLTEIKKSLISILENLFFYVVLTGGSISICAVLCIRIHPLRHFLRHVKQIHL